MFAVILSAVCTLLFIYVCLRIYSIGSVRQRIGKKIGVLGASIFWILFLVSLIMGHDGSGSMAAAQEFFAMNCLGVLFLAASFLFFTEFITGFGFFFKSSTGYIRGSAISAALLLSLFALLQGLRPPVISSHHVMIPGLPPQLDQTVLVAVSDLHLGSQLGEKWARERVLQIKALHPDLVVFIGDIIEGHGPIPAKISQQFHAIDPPLGLWAVTGNHEFFGGIDKNTQFFAEANISLLRNSWTVIAPGLTLAGVDDLTYARRSGGKKDLIAQTLTNHPQGSLILLSHSPWQSQQAAKLGVNLMLSGHTHNGQIWPFNYLVKLFYPLISGRYQVGSMTALVCRGTGTWGPRMRLWERGEILKITLRSPSPP